MKKMVIDMIVHNDYLIRFLYLFLSSSFSFCLYFFTISSIVPIDFASNSSFRSPISAFTLSINSSPTSSQTLQILMLNIKYLINEVYHQHMASPLEEDQNGDEKRDNDKGKGGLGIERGLLNAVKDWLVNDWLEEKKRTNIKATEGGGRRWDISFGIRG